MGKFGKLFITFFVALFYALMFYLIQPPLSLAYNLGFNFIAIGLCFLTTIIVMWLTDDIEVCVHGGLVALVIWLVIYAIGNIIGSSLFTWDEKYTQIGEIEEKSFTQDIVEIDTSQIPIVDIDLAGKLADKKLGEDLALGSQMRVGEFTNKQQIDGKLYYVAPLEHINFWKWRKNKAGTVGYVMVSATNLNDVKLVKQVNDKDLRLKFLSSSFFSSNLTRHIRNSGFRSQGLSEYNFELDDDGNPYWIVGTYENSTCWANPEATGVIIVDAQNGECKWYALTDVPEWVDIVQPESFVKKQIENYGEYVHGVFNWSDEDKLTMTDHITTVYNDGDCYYYTGLSSYGKDNGTVGFIMVNTRTKKSTLYRMVGATESSAMSSAQGKVQDMGYSATVPIPLNISGIPTYFCTLKDGEGLVKQYSMVNIEDYSIVECGSTIAETKRAYINAVNGSGASIDFGDGTAYGYTVEGTVSRITANVENGNTYYYMILDNDASKLYLASYTVSEELPITREGDKVKVSYVDEKNGTINIISFDNIGFAQEISEKQEQLNQEREEDNLINNDDNNIINVDPEENQNAWDSLSDEEKAKLLENLNKE